MSILSCGIDFGTSNSSVAVAHRDEIKLVPVEGSHITIPSAIFFQRPNNVPVFGRAATDMFFKRINGRFMRSLKRVLGTSLMKHGTAVNDKPMTFEKILASFLKHLKDKADVYEGINIENVTMGRPVHFVDNDPAADKQAEYELRGIARSVGFKNIEFQFEPIAAAFAHEVNVVGEQLAMVADLGGGTSDFSVIRLSKAFIHKPDRSKDILGNSGVRIGGNDFDKDLSLATIMPEIGYGSTYGEKNLEVPSKFYHDLSEWSKVNFVYTTKILSQTRQIFYQSREPEKFGRLLKILEQESGHSLLAAAEETKIELTNTDTVLTKFDFIEHGLGMTIRRQEFNEAIHERIEKISRSATECLKRAGVKNVDVDLVILTGGSTEVPAIQDEFKRLFPGAKIADQNKLSSVGTGLAYDSRNRFR